MMPKAAASAAVPGEPQWPSIAPRWQFRRSHSGRQWILDRWNLTVKRLPKDSTAEAHLWSAVKSITMMMKGAVFGVLMKVLRDIQDVILEMLRRSMNQDLRDPLDQEQLLHMMCDDLRLDLRLLQGSYQRLSDCVRDLMNLVAMSEMSDEEAKILGMIP